MQRYRQSPNDGPMLADEAGPWAKVETMTTPLEAQELAKRLRDKAELEEHLAPNLARLLREAAAFLERPVNTGQGVTEEEVERACEAYAKGTGYYVTFHRGLSSESSDRMRSGMRAALTAARTPLASVEGATLQELRKHVFLGARSSDMRRAVQIIDAALAQSGRSSAEPVADLRKTIATEILMVRGENPYRVHRGGREAWERWLHVSDAILALPAIKSALTPPVGPQEAVAVLEQRFAVAKKLDPLAFGQPYTGDGDADAPRDPWVIRRKLAQAQAADILSALSPSGIDLGGEVERLRVELNDAWVVFGNVPRDKPLADHIADALNELADMAKAERVAREAAEARLATAEKALRPFANIPDDTKCNDGHMLENAGDDALACGINIWVASIRAAREALASLSTNAVREGDDA